MSPAGARARRRNPLSSAFLTILIPIWSTGWALHRSAPSQPRAHFRAVSPCCRESLRRPCCDLQKIWCGRLLRLSSSFAGISSETLYPRPRGLRRSSVFLGPDEPRRRMRAAYTCHSNNAWPGYQEMPQFPRKRRSRRSGELSPTWTFQGLNRSTECCRDRSIPGESPFLLPKVNPCARATGPYR